VKYKISKMRIVGYYAHLKCKEHKKEKKYKLLCK